MSADLSTSAARVERIAARIGARRRPSHEAWRRDRTLADGGEFYWTEPGGADDSTMVAFVAGDGNTSLRSLTWREVVAEVLAELENDDA